MISMNITIRRTELTLVSCAMGLAVTMPASIAHAQSTSAYSLELFEQGRALLREKRYDEACPKLAESARLDPGSGTLLALGVCREGQQRYASARGAYIEAAAAARRDQRRDREEVATARALAMEKRGSRVTLVVPADLSSLKGFTLMLDGVLLGSAAWTSVPVDGGEHEVETSAPGKTPASVRFTIGVEGEKKEIQIPALEDASPPPTPRRPVIAGMVTNAQGPIDEMGPRPMSGQRIAGFILGGVGVASLGVGTFFGIRALNKAGEANAACLAPRCTDRSAVELADDAKIAADVSTITISAGAALAVGGLVLVLTAPSSKPRTTEGVRVTPTFGPNVQGITIGGVF